MGAKIHSWWSQWYHQFNRVDLSIKTFLYTSTERIPIYVYQNNLQILNSVHLTQNVLLKIQIDVLGSQWSRIDHSKKDVLQKGSEGRTQKQLFITVSTVRLKSRVLLNICIFGCSWLPAVAQSVAAASIELLSIEIVTLWIPNAIIL